MINFRLIYQRVVFLQNILSLLQKNIDLWANKYSILKF